jgi:hypothetical protein
MITFVNRGWPLPWAVELHGDIVQIPPPAVYPFDFQALNFSIDLTMWMMIFLLPSLLFVYWKTPEEHQTPTPANAPTL